ncbi:MAG: hypothetical protein KAI59_03940 [Planctomycetes bacterium]|nr:hypothetical protein [Planctomycetota bacterium]MCK5473159.1 hypothetical protein [Planctomycetota bacterium]
MNPSSTDAIGLLFLPFILIIGAIILLVIFGLGYLMGCLAKILGLHIRRDIKMAVAILSILGSLVFGFVGIRSYNLPRLTYSDGSVLRDVESGEISAQNLLEAKVFESEDRDSSHEISWNNEMMIFTFSTDSIELVEKDSGKAVINLSLSKYDYIMAIHIQETKLFADKDNYLAILAELRATSRLALLMFFSNDGKEIYRELIRRETPDMSLFKNRIDDVREDTILLNENTYIYKSKVF